MDPPPSAGAPGLGDFCREHHRTLAVKASPHDFFGGSLKLSVQLAWGFGDVWARGGEILGQNLEVLGMGLLGLPLRVLRFPSFRNVPHNALATECDCDVLTLRR